MILTELNHFYLDAYAAWLYSDCSHIILDLRYTIYWCPWANLAHLSTVPRGVATQQTMVTHRHYMGLSATHVYGARGRGGVVSPPPITTIPPHRNYMFSTFTWKLLSMTRFILMMIPTMPVVWKQSTNLPKKMTSD